MKTNRKYLEKRRDSRKTFRELHRAWYSYTRKGKIDFFNAEKILVGYIVASNTYCQDSDGFMFSVGRTFAIIPNDRFLLESILAILNSKVSKFYMLSLCPIKQGGYFKISSAYLGSFPIPILIDKLIDNMTKTVTEIHFLKMKNPKADTADLEKLMDQIVYKLYGLTATEIQIVEEAVK